MWDERLYELARTISEHPGTWMDWPTVFRDRSEAEREMEVARDGGIESFRVDSAAFQHRHQAFRDIVGEEPGEYHVEVRCAW